MTTQNYPLYFDPTHGSFIITVNNENEERDMREAMLFPRLITDWEARVKMVHHMVDFMDDGFRNYCDGNNINNPCNPVVINKIPMAEIVAMYEAFIQSWGLAPITLEETAGGVQ